MFTLRHIHVLKPDLRTMDLLESIAKSLQESLQPIDKRLLMLSLRDIHDKLKHVIDLNHSIILLQKETAKRLKEAVENGADQAELLAMAGELDSAAAESAAAVITGTPADPNPDVPLVPAPIFEPPPPVETQPAVDPAGDPLVTNPDTQPTVSGVPDAVPDRAGTNAPASPLENLPAEAAASPTSDIPATPPSQGTSENPGSSTAPVDEPPPAA